ncbi:MAG: cysteine--tRNA ligase [Micrococcales bacterium]|nr:cysteine--tRNA ligase [Micrococcales bacterium]
MIRLYDSRQQAVVDLEPRAPGRIGMYVCGPTVQSSPHLGHLRSALVYDLWRRWLGYRGFEVTFVRNVTDIDDKVLDNATDAEPWWALAYRVELEFARAYRTLGILDPTYEPRATAAIPGMIALIERLLVRGHAYAADDGSGDVYFDVRSWPAYGELTRQRVEDMAASVDVDPRGKRDPRDFALWKGRKSTEPVSAAWAAPWGEGRPGWHIECSAMSRLYLGAEFDIHGGGLDLRFPHHENELAQSSAAGDAFARRWVHNGLVTIAGQKMSKSLGNSVFAAELLGAARPLAIRYFLAGAHYRSSLDYHAGSLAEAEAAVARIESFVTRVGRRLSGTAEAAQVLPAVPEAFAVAMDDDLSVPEALAVLHDRIRSGNTALDGGDLDAAAAALGEVRAMTGVLGIDPQAPEWRGAGDDAATAALEALVERMLGDRQTARERREFAVADRIRDELSAAGITIEDAPDGARWSIS